MKASEISEKAIAKTHCDIISEHAQKAKKAIGNENAQEARKSLDIIKKSFSELDYYIFILEEFKK